MGNVENYSMSVFIVCFFSCREKKKKIDKDLQIAKNNTFDFYDNEYNIPNLSGFSVDTIKHFNKVTQFSQTIICPRINGK